MDRNEITLALLEARKKLTETISKELLGPGSEVSYPDEKHELISEPASQRYTVGILYPREQKMNEDNDGNEEKSEEESEKITDFDEASGTTEPATSADSIRPAKSLNTEDYSAPESKESEQEVSLAQQNRPSSLGFTFFVSAGIKHLKVDIETAEYKAIPKNKLNNELVFPYDGDEISYIPDSLSGLIKYDSEKKEVRCLDFVSKSQLDDLFERNHIEDQPLLYDLILNLNRYKYGAFRRQPWSESVVLDFSKTQLPKILLLGKRVQLTAVLRHISTNVDAITVMFSNETKSDTFYQTQIKVCLSNVDASYFIPKNHSALINSDSIDEDDLSLSMLYRKKLSYATGHGVSTDWSIDKKGHGYIKTTYLPLYEVPRIRFDLRKTTENEKKVDKSCLSMKELSGIGVLSKEDIFAEISAFIETYGEWIETLKSEILLETFDFRYIKAAEKHITYCYESFGRMKTGLNILSKDEKAWQSFQLANRAMFMQRIHSRFQNAETDSYPNDKELQNKLKSIDYDSQPDEHFWRPFQLAFLLMSVNSIVKPNSGERDLVDLIWFPTGGGKTEAYLGLTAFTIFHRRLTDFVSSGGTAVFMRYTLRLLTSQQFTRAATLICACEQIRKKEKKLNLGTEEITIGLWIGGAHIPNKLTTGSLSAKECLEKLTSAEAGDLDYRKDRYNKFQVLKCPWCGTKIVKDKIEIVDKEGEIGEFGYALGKNRFIVHCTQEGCPYEAELPIKLIDEDIYNKPPTLLFGTVDKFAMVAWNEQTRRLFGLGTENRSPDLIIQDELHLISGPLGSIVGIYETAIDWLCSWKGVKPKIIASTATIRKAKDQMRSLYNREMRQFPAPGLDASDSFFATEEKLFDDVGLRISNGRLYCGIMPSGKTKAILQARTFAITLQAIKDMSLPDEAKDYLWTETGYFNSLRDLGKASALIDDDVKDFIKRLAYRKSLFSRIMPRSLGKTYELTSRVHTTELLDTLDKLEHLKYTQANVANHKYAVSTLLASNMISVGVDIDRLNMMLVCGQPKLVSEYIQASSRIGRSYPGIALVLYDSAKSRDRSYYEMFLPFHESFYKFVEPTGLTPFSIPARNKALHAVFIAALRLSAQDIVSEQSAGNLESKAKHKDLIDKIITFVQCRVRDINATNPSFNDDSHDVRKEMEDIVEYWSQKAELVGDAPLYYGYRFIIKPPVGETRLIRPFHQGNDLAKETLTSMRNVDSTLKSSIIVWQEKTGE